MQHNTLIAVLELTVIAIVASVVWTTVLVGLYQFIRGSLRRVHVTLTAPRRATYTQRSKARAAHAQPSHGH